MTKRSEEWKNVTSQKLKNQTNLTKNVNLFGNEKMYELKQILSK